MCYEFVHECSSQLHKSISQLESVDRFFLICIGVLNYLYSTDEQATNALVKLIVGKQILLHSITESELMNIINESETKPFQTFLGSRRLYEDFCARNAT